MTTDTPSATLKELERTTAPTSVETELDGDIDSEEKCREYPIEEESKVENEKEAEILDEVPNSAEVHEGTGEEEDKPNGGETKTDNELEEPEAEPNEDSAEEPKGAGDVLCAVSSEQGQSLQQQERRKELQTEARQHAVNRRFPYRRDVPSRFMNFAADKNSSYARRLESSRRIREALAASSRAKGARDIRSASCAT